MATDPVTQRVEQLETLVRSMLREVGELRATVDRLEGGGAEIRASVRTGAPIEERKPRNFPVGGPPHAPGESAERPGTTADAAAQLHGHPAAAAEAFSGLSAAIPPGSAAGPALRAPRSSATRPPAPRSPASAPIDIETLFGRHAAKLIGALAVLLAAGSIVRWAVDNVRLNPATRVLLGALLAVGIASAGLMLRRRGVLRYGNTLLALALAVTHVVAYGAGPYLHLVPNTVALGVAALASALLAGLAFRDGSESLFAVGVGGALLAPFVTSGGDGSPVALLAYGITVLAGGMWALGDRPWTAARRLSSAAVGVYAAAAADAATRTDYIGQPGRVLAGGFALVIAWMAIAIAGPRHRRELAISALLVLAVSIGAGELLPAAGRFEQWGLAYAALGTLTSFALARIGRLSGASAALEGAILPLIFLAVVLPYAGSPELERGALLSAVWAGACVAAALLAPADRGAIRAAHATAAAIALVGAGVLYFVDRDHLLGALALSVYAAGLALLARRERGWALLLPAALALVIGTVWSYDLLSLRTAYDYRPFLTEASLAAAVNAACWTVFAWHAGRVGTRSGFEEHAVAPGDVPDGPAPDMGVVRMIGGTAVFFWIRAELIYAGSRDLATFLLLGFYALAGVAAITLGRMRGIAAARQAGLALAIYAGFKALAQASDVTSVALRVASYLLVGGFLLAVAYWYRGGEGVEHAAVDETVGEPTRQATESAQPGTSG